MINRPGNTPTLDSGTTPSNSTGPTADQTVIRPIIVVPFYNGHEFLDRLIQSVDYPGTTVVLVDNSEIQSHFDVPAPTGVEIEVVRTRPRIGFGRANNVGAAVASRLGATHVVFANQDGYFRPCAIDRLVRASMELGAGIVSALTDGIDDARLNPTVIRYYLARIPDYINDLRDGVEPRTVYRCKQPIGGCFIVPISRLEELPLFEPEIFMYGEDVDYFQRCNQHGIPMGIVPAARFAHAHSNASPSKADRRRIDNHIWHSKLTVVARDGTPQNLVDAGARVALQVGVRLITRDRPGFELARARLDHVWRARRVLATATRDNLRERIAAAVRDDYCGDLNSSKPLRG